MNIVIMIIFVLIMIFFLNYNVKARDTYYLAPDGSDDNPGSLEAPWNSLQKAAEKAQAGDTVVFKPGKYRGQLIPQNSGTEEKPIIFKSQKRHEAIFLGGKNGGYAVKFENISHILFEGFWMNPRLRVPEDGKQPYLDDRQIKIYPEMENQKIMGLNNASYINIKDNIMDETIHGSSPIFRCQDSEQIKFMNNTVRGWVHNMIQFGGNSKKILIEGNSISKGGHSPLQFYPEKTNEDIVIRGNVFHCGIGRNFELFTVHKFLFEDNILTNGLNGGRSADASAKLLGFNGIFRFNRVFRNPGSPLAAVLYRKGLYFTGIRLYHNVFDYNAKRGIGLSGGQHADLEDVVFLNNIFSRNDPFGYYRQIQTSDQTILNLKFINNVITGDKPGRLQTIQLSNYRSNIEDLQEKDMEMFKNNYDLLPKYVNPDQYKHTLKPESSLREQGRHLTWTKTAGEGKELEVEDALYFYDGFGIKGEKGDLIVVGNSQQKARIKEVQREENKLILDRELTWDEGVPVGFPWAGASPDIGVYEHGDKIGPSVRIERNGFKFEPEEEVKLKAVVKNIVNPKFDWWLGDGTRTDGQRVVHSYKEPKDYPIRLKVTDNNGDVYRATEYILIKEPEEKPLLHTTFNLEDEDWWWRWQTYRPRPNEWQRNIDFATGEGSLVVKAPSEQKGKMSAATYPAFWDIDKYPDIYIRYRIKPKTRIALYLQAFEAPKYFDGNVPPNDTTRRRRVVVATSSEAREVVADEDIGDKTKTLKDDGEWHELRTDARLVRESYPEVKVLQGMYIRDESEESIPSNAQYELDEVKIY